MNEPHVRDTPPTSCYRHPKIASGVSCQRCEKMICGQCMTAASVGHHCPDCVKQKSQKVIPARSLMSPGGIGGADPIVTKVLIAINVIVNVLVTVGNNNAESAEALARIDNEGVLITLAVADGEWWRLLTAGFLHFGWIHLFMNMFGLWIFGSQLEPQLGRARYLTLYMGSLFAGSAAVMLIEDPSAFVRTAGASGAIYGLLGAFAMAAYSKGRNLWQEGIIGMIGLYVFFTFANRGISIGGHIGGLIGGLALGGLFFVGARKLVKNDKNEKMLLPLGIAFTVLMAVLGVVFANMAI